MFPTGGEPFTFKWSKWFVQNWPASISQVNVSLPCKLASLQLCGAAHPLLGFKGVQLRYRTFWSMVVDRVTAVLLVDSTSHFLQYGIIRNKARYQSQPSLIDLVDLRRYAIGLTAMTLTFVIGEGWQGPLSVMITLALPPEIRSFAISLFFAVAQLIGPAGSVLFGIYLTVTHPRPLRTHADLTGSVSLPSVVCLPF